MKKRRVAVGTVIVASMLAAAGLAAPATAASGGPAGCSAAEQQSGDCIGWVGAPGSEMPVDAIASELGLGRVALAQHFFDKNQTQFTPAGRQGVADALQVAHEHGAEAGADALSDASDPDGAAGSANGTAATPDAVATTSDATNSATTMATSVPEQETNGAKLATGWHAWVLHGKDYNEVAYGDCSSTSGCETLGTAEVTLKANTYYPGEGPHWYQDVWRLSGATPYIKNNNIEVKVDHNNWMDYTIATVECPVGGYSVDCNKYTPVSLTKGDWYYFNVNWSWTLTGYPDMNYHVTTRRWQVVSASNWEFMVYGIGG